MAKPTPMRKVGLNIMRGVPFLLELKVIMDWSFSKTSLDLFQWFKFEDLHATVYSGKVESMSVFSQKVG